jgi:uncharacterized membrane protein
VDRGRLEAFSDGVFAIIITITVLGLRPPDDDGWSGLNALRQPFLVYALTFVYLGIYWNNHHHLLKNVVRVSAGIMWSNLGLLFWLTLLPFATDWLGHHWLALAPTVVYGAVLLLAGCAYYLLQTLIVHQAGGRESPLGVALGRDWKGRLAPPIYLVAIASAWVSPAISACLYVAVALAWVVPDRRLERVLT